MWDDENNCMTEAKYGVMNTPLPIFHMLPAMDFVPPKEDYICPLYKEALRQGTFFIVKKFNFSQNFNLKICNSYENSQFFKKFSTFQNNFKVCCLQLVILPISWCLSIYLPEKFLLTGSRVALRFSVNYLNNLFLYS